jgi:hypothetical protein
MSPNPPSRKKLFAIIACSIVFLATAALLGRASAVLSNSMGSIEPHGHWYEYVEYIEAPADAGKTREFYFHSNATVDIYLLNSTAFGTWLNNGTLLAPPAFASTADVVEPWSIDFLNATRGFEVNSTLSGSRKVVFFVLVVNSADATVKFVARLDYKQWGTLLSEFSVFCQFLAILCFSLVSIRLLAAARSLKKEEGQANRAQSLRGFGIGYALVTAELLLAVFRVQWENNTGGFLPKLFGIEYNIPGFPISYFDLFICTILVLGSLTFFTLCYIVEKKVKGRRVPIFSYNLLVSMALVVLIFAFPPMFVFSIVYLIIALALAAAQIIVIYFALAIRSEGVMRRRSILIALGIIIPFISIAFRLFLVNSIPGLYDYRSLFELGNVVGVLCFYWGNIKYLEK